MVIGGRFLRGCFGCISFKRLSALFFELMGGVVFRGRVYVGVYIFWSRVLF